MRKEKSKRTKRSKKIGGILDINRLVPVVNNLRYLVWNTIPEGTLVLYTNPVNPQHYGIYVVRGGPSILSLYTLENTLEPNNTLRCSSDNFRIIVQINNAINYDTGIPINGIFYGLITGYGIIGTDGGIFVTGLHNNNLIYNTYRLNDPNLSLGITAITYDDINPNRVGVLELRGETLNLFNTMNNYITGGGNNERRNQIINLRILNEQRQWVIPNNEVIGNAQDMPALGFNFGRNPGGPPVGPQVGPPGGSNIGSQNSHQDQGIRNRWLEETDGQANPGAAFGNYVANAASYGPNNPFGQVRDFGNRQNAFHAELRSEETIEQKEKKLDDWIEVQNTRISITPAVINPLTRLMEAPEVVRIKTKDEIKKEEEKAKNRRSKLLKKILDGKKNDEKCPICQDTFTELSSEPAPYNEIYSCKNIHLICGHCKNSMDERNKEGGYLWAHTTPIWKCLVCKNVSRNADRLTDFEEAYKKSQGKSSKSGGGSTTMYKNVGKKEILGTTRIIYKMKGSNKEYVKDKGMFIHVTEYKKIKSKNNKNK
jgi:rubrerythrin